MTDELKPCPFCGGEVELKGVDGYTWWIECLLCELEMGFILNRGELIERWNRPSRRKEKANDG